MSTTTAVRERPILFSGPMVRAILEERKTQTRRVLKHPLVAQQRGVGTAIDFDTRQVSFCYEDRSSWTIEVPFPYGVPGDRLWVRETFAVYGEFQNGTGYCYRADGDLAGVTWRPSIFMPRALSRITLEITRVRVEPLHEISDADIAAEGFDNRNGAFDGMSYMTAHGKWLRVPPHGPMAVAGPRGHFASGWDKLNAKRGYSWAGNPWVWVIEFRRIEQP